MEAMLYVSNEISQIPGVIDAFPHKDLAGHGRWSIMTDTTHFKPVIAALETNVATWICFYCDWENITLSTLPPPSLALRTQPYEDHSDTTFSIYMSGFTNMYALQDNSCDQPPKFNGPSPQSWSPPSTVSYAATVSISDTSPSQISQEAFDKVTQENTCLSWHVDELVAQVSALLQQSKHKFVEPLANSTSPSSPPSSPPANTTLNPQTTVTPTPSVPSLPPGQVQAIVNQAAATVLSAIESSRKHQPTRTTEVLESSTSCPNAMLDTSFDSDTMHHE